MDEKIISGTENVKEMVWVSLEFVTRQPYLVAHALPDMNCKMIPPMLKCHMDILCFSKNGFRRHHCQRCSLTHV